MNNISMKKKPSVKNAMAKMKEQDRKILMTLAGVAVVAGSVVAVADYVKRKKHQKAAHVAQLIFGMAGVAAGTLIATEPRREANRITLELDDIFEGIDIEVARRQVREALNRAEADAEADPIPVTAVEAEPVAEETVVVAEGVEVTAESALPTAEQAAEA